MNNLETVFEISANANGVRSDWLWRIAIGEREFEIDYWRQTPGYNLTIAHGGVLRDGVHARLTYDRGVLLKVELPLSSRR